MTPDATSRRALLLDIARCNEIHACLADQSRGSPCAAVVWFQNSSSLAEHQVAEPWTGRLASAPLLFVSSNPAISAIELYPTWDSPDDLLFTYFEERFLGFIRGGKYPLRIDGQYDAAQPFWSGVRSMAEELFGREAVPGNEYALTELVHCKSSSEQSGGVDLAMPTCVDRYFSRVLTHASARMIVVLGDLAGMAVRGILGVQNDVRLTPHPVSLGGRERLVLFLGHPTGPRKRKPSEVLTPAELERVRAWITSGPTTGG